MNGPAVRATLRALLLRQSLLLPHVSVPHVRCVDWARLRGSGVRAVVFDKDNTLTVPHRLELLPGAAEALQGAVQEFGEGSVMVFSNSAGSWKDRGFVGAAETEAVLGVPVLRHGTQKPDGADALLEALGGPSPGEVAVVGDRYTTDVLFANLSGMRAVKTGLVTEEGESRWGLRLRRLEDWVVGGLRRAGVRPPR